MKKKHSALKDLLFVSISSFIVAAAWVGFNIYHTWVTTTITPEMQITITAIDPNFDTKTIQKLKARKQVTPINGLSGQPAADPTTEPAPSSTPASVSTSIQSSIPTATPAPTTALIPGAEEIVTQPTQAAPPATIESQPESEPQDTDIPVTVEGE